MKKFIFNFTPTGMIPTREMSPYIPLQIDEILNQVVEAAELGVNIVHLHARDPKTETPTHQKDIYAEIIRGIRKQFKDLLISVSTSGRHWSDFKKRSEVLELEGEVKPDFASLTLSSLNFNKQASINSPQTIKALAAKMHERGIRPEFEVFDLGMINYAKYLIKKGFFKSPYYFNMILGNIACAQADLLSLGLMVRELPNGSFWSAGGVGNPQLKVNVMALISGGGVRAGLEDNIWFDEERTRLATNKEVVERVLHIAKVLNLTPYTHREARELLAVSS